jgi:hypothetical protein
MPVLLSNDSATCNLQAFMADFPYWWQKLPMAEAEIAGDWKNGEFRTVNAALKSKQAS